MYSYETCSTGREAYVADSRSAGGQELSQQWDQAVTGRKMQTATQRCIEYGL